MQPFYDATRLKTLCVQRCDSCGSTFFPAVDVCSQCFGERLSWIECSGQGEVFSFVVVHHVYHPAFATRTPYVVADVKLDEGPRMRSNIAGVAAGDVHVGMRVKAAFECFGNDLWLPLFEPNSQV
jgi:uncharacterized OB-fold protein